MTTSENDPCYDRPPSTADNIGLAIGVGLTWLLSVAAGVAVFLSNSNTCEDPADPAGVHRGQLGLGLVLALAALPWAIGFVRSRRRFTVGVLAFTALVPSLWMFASGLAQTSSNGGWCMF